MAETDNRAIVVVAEVFRLAIVVAIMAAGFAVGDDIARALERTDVDTVRLVTSGLGALAGYLIGGLLGRTALRRVDRVQTDIQSLETPELIAGVLGGTVAALFSIVFFSPVMVLPGRTVTVPFAIALTIMLVYAGTRIGMTRSGDLSRFIGVRGRVSVRTPSRGVGTRVVDSSALIDARLVDVARAGFLDGTLVVTQFVLEELQGLADAEDPHRRALGRRGLDAVVSLQEDGIVSVEVTEEDPADVATVDGKLAAICRRRGAALVTTDANLAQVAEVGGVRVLNVNALAEAVRPPAVPGDRLTLRVVKPGSEAGQGVGYLEDGTMVVIERAADHVGTRVDVDVTSIVTNRRGRMLFARRADES